MGVLRFHLHAIAHLKLNIQDRPLEVWKDFMCQNSCDWKGCLSGEETSPLYRYPDYMDSRLLVRRVLLSSPFHRPRASQYIIIFWNQLTTS